MTTTNLHEKLDPKRFPGMSLMMAALVGYVLGEKFTDPAIAELTVTSDKHVLATHEGDIGANNFIGAYDDLHANFTRLLDAAELTAEERAEFAKLYQLKLQRPLH